MSQPFSKIFTYFTPEGVPAAMMTALNDVDAQSYVALDQMAKLEMLAALNIEGVSPNQLPAMVAALDKICTDAKITPAPVAASTVQPASQPMSNLLPPPPDDTSFAAMLKVGGNLKVETTEVVAALRAAIASNAGLYGLPEIILEKMSAVAESMDEPSPASYYRLQKLVSSRAYGDVLAVLDVPGTFVSDKKKRDMLLKLNTLLWPALGSFHNQLVGWQNAWTSTASNPNMILTVLAMGQAGGAGAMPPGMMAPPDTAALHDAAESFVAQVNRVFAGPGIPVARAMAYDAMRIREVLDDPELPAAVGAVNREQMLKLLGVGVGADLVRLERSVVQYALAIMELQKVTPGNTELAYLGAMIQLGVSIPWDKLGVGTSDPSSPRRTRPTIAGTANSNY